MSWMSTLAKKRTPRKTEETTNWKPKKIKISAKVGPVFTYGLSGGEARLHAPRQLRHRF